MHPPAEYAPRCTSCAATALTPPTYIANVPNQNRLQFRQRGARAGFFAPAPEEFFVISARACLNCGHVMLALPPEELAALRARMPALEPVPPSLQR